MLFGPAYKGIPLAAATAVALAGHRGRNVAYAYNRKEAKDHGEGGILVGAPLAGRVLIVDDVISAGTSARESIELIRETGASVVGLAIALDRQERGQDKISATKELNQTHGIPCIAIATLDDLIQFLATRTQTGGGIQGQCDGQTQDSDSTESQDDKIRPGSSVTPGMEQALRRGRRRRRHQGSLPKCRRHPHHPGRRWSRPV